MAGTTPCRDMVRSDRAAAAACACSKAPAPSQAADIARLAGLVYVTDADPGYARRRAGKGFSYRDRQGHAVRDAATLARIGALAIPPAYTEVWICMDARGHLQATGRDARRRKQYRYHPRWIEVSGEGKYDRIVQFGATLPRLRRRLRQDLGLPGFPREKVLAIVVAVMAETLVRVGNATYARDNRSFGLTTLRNRHAAFARDRVRLQFRGKGGLEHDIGIDDARLVKLIRAVQHLPGQALFQYRDDEGTLQPVDSGQVNAYLRQVMGQDFTAKDFRTWGGTLAAFKLLAATPVPAPPSKAALTRARNAVIKEVARALGNTPAVARKAYIDPCMFQAWEDGRLQTLAATVRGQRQWEQAALKLLSRVHKVSLRSARKVAAATR
ncbi:DNA topoisomerase IB [Pseudoxanthomonas spadix]|jgi:DNA topoisomerase IB|nr:DNA topoisomerase IB [Pseudoxanthomonas spadix]MBP3974075.1 DNA topoisomerase IB [Pseudoxanthomonas spadix]